MIPVLTTDRKSCTIGEVVLQLSQSIDYKSSIENQVGVGRILEFRHSGYCQSDKESVWMNVQDAVEDNKKEWISVQVWYSQHEAGLFGVKKVVKNDTDKGQDNSDNLPF